MKRLVRFIAAACVAAMLVQASPATAQTLVDSPIPLEAPEVGVNVHLLWSDQTHEQRTEIIEKMAAANLEWIRIDLAWASVQPDGPDTYSTWAIEWIERYAALAHERGMKVLVTFWSTPAWANGGAGRHVSPDDPADLDRAIRHTASELRDSVDAWEFWNEPNLASFFSEPPAAYVDMLKVAYPAFKAADPSAPVVLGGTSYTDAAWLESVYDAGAQPYFDILAIHPYMAPADLPPETDNGEMWTISAVGGVRTLMALRGDDTKPIWFTEFGWSSHPNESASCKEVYDSNRDPYPDDGVSCSSNATMGVTEAQQADYFARAIDYVTSKNLREGWGVTNMLWYNERNKATGKLHEDNFGLLNRDLTPKPAYSRIASYLGATAGGGFETGTDGWSARRASLARVSHSRSGGSSLRISPHRRGPEAVVGATVDGPGAVEAVGYVWTRTRQPLRVVLLEKRGSEIVQRTDRSLRTTGKRWTQLPTASLTAEGGAQLVLKIVNKAAEPQRFWLDDMAVSSTP